MKSQVRIAFQVIPNMSCLGRAIGFALFVSTWGCLCLSAEQTSQEMIKPGLPFEIRITYGLNDNNQSSRELCVGCPSPDTIPTVPKNYGLGIDAIYRGAFNLPELGLGLRYENLGFLSSASGYDVKALNVRNAILASYRLLDTSDWYFGPIATFGFAHSTIFELSLNRTTLQSYRSNDVTSYSVGAEIGLKLESFRFGIEAGYLDETWKDATSNVSSVVIKNISFSGSYAKILLGFAF